MNIRLKKFSPRDFMAFNISDNKVLPPPDQQRTTPVDDPQMSSKKRPSLSFLRNLLNPSSQHQPDTTVIPVSRPASITRLESAAIIIPAKTEGSNMSEESPKEGPRRSSFDRIWPRGAFRLSKNPLSSSPESRPQESNISKNLTSLEKHEYSSSVTSSPPNNSSRSSSNSSSRTSSEESVDSEYNSNLEKVKEIVSVMGQIEYSLEKLILDQLASGFIKENEEIKIRKFVFKKEEDYELQKMNLKNIIIDPLTLCIPVKKKSNDSISFLLKETKRRNSELNLEEYVTLESLFEQFNVSRYVTVVRIKHILNTLCEIELDDFDKKASSECFCISYNPLWLPPVYRYMVISVFFSKV